MLVSIIAAMDRTGLIGHETGLPWHLPADLRRQYSIVLQESLLFATSITENIAYAKPDATQAEIYAAAGIKDYWVVDVNGHIAEVMRDPRDGRYRSLRTYGAEETVSPLALPRAELHIDSLFPSRK